MNLEKHMQALADSAGIDFIGTADLSSAIPFIKEQGGDVVDGFPLAISIGIRLPDPIVDMLPKRTNKAVAVNYRFHAYTYINQRLDALTSQLAGFIQRAGYKVLPVPAAERCNDERLCAVFSHKLAAHLAGFGWIGKGCLLITPQYGPRVRWSSILTDAPIKPSGKPMDEKCGDCPDCVEICPMNAFTGRNFDPKEPREMRYDARKCDEYFRSMKNKGDLPVCGMCLYVCPYGKKNS